MTTSTVTGIDGRQLPNLEFHGLAKTMEPAATLIEKQAELRRRKSELGHEQQQLREDIKRRQRALTAAWGRSLRVGEVVPTDEGIEVTKQRLEEVGREIAAVSHAGQLAADELRQLVGESRDRWNREVEGKSEQILAEAMELVEALTRKVSETDHLVGVRSLLMSSGVNYTPASPISIPLEHVLVQRRRELGIVGEGYRMSEDLSFLSDSDLQAIDDIVEGAHRRQMGEHILAAVADAEERNQRGEDPALEILRRAHQAKAEEGNQP